MTGGDRDETADHHRDPNRVREVYDDIASHFSKTRQHAWPEVEEFVAGCSPASRGLDIGCGNGRHMAVLRRKTDSVVGVDTSRNLLLEARNRGNRESWEGNFVMGDAASLPFASGTVDIAVYVATIHHLPNRAQRRATLDELGRVLRKGGRGLVSAWSTAHDRFDASPDTESGFDTTVDWTLPGGKTVPRFYHIYAPAEFEEDVAQSGLEIVALYLSSGNCYAEVTATR